MRYLILLLVVLSMSTSTFAGDEAVTSAKSLGLGNVGGFNFSSEAIFENPASLKFSQKASVSALYTSYMLGETKVFVGSGAWKIDPQWTVAVGLNRLSMDNFFQTAEDSNGDVIKTGATFGFGQTDYTAGVAYHITPDLSLGFSGTFIDQKIATFNGSSLQWNAGLHYTAPFAQFSLVGKNLLAQRIRYNDASNQIMDRSVAASMLYPIASDLSLLAELNAVSQPWTLLKKVGLAWQIAPELQLRGGWHEIKANGTVAKAFTFGVGFNVDDSLTINYAYEKNDYIEDANSHFISLQMWLR
jgi:hypothetical protein